MKISIIIPVYNVSQYIERCICSVLGQTYDNIEIIIVDDCSPDNSIQIARECVDSHPRKEAVVFASHEQNRGLSAARNTGIGLATGDYLYFLDSDDELPIDSIATLANVAIESIGANVIVGNFDVINDIQNKVLKYELSSSYIKDNNEILKLYAEEKWPTIAWNKLIETKFLKEHKLYFKEGILHEDVLWSFLLANRATSMGIVDKNTYKYFIRESSITSKIRSKNINCYCIIIEEIKNAIDTTIFPANESNNIILEKIRNTALKRLFYLEDKDEQYLFFKKIRDFKIVRASSNLSTWIIDFILKLPILISFHIFKGVVRRKR